MNSLRSPLHIPFTYQVPCAPVGARHLPFTCFASHATLLPHPWLLHPPKRCARRTQSSARWSFAEPQPTLRTANPNKVFAPLTTFLIGGLPPLVNCASLRVAAGWSGCHDFCNPICLQSLHFAQSCLLPSTQPLSATRARVAHSLHYTSLRTFITQYDFDS